MAVMLSHDSLRRKKEYFYFVPGSFLRVLPSLP